MFTCIYTKKQFEKASKEHILQNFLGAKWVCDTISSDEAQHAFGESIDLSLSKDLKFFKALLGSKGSREAKNTKIKPTKHNSLQGLKSESGASYSMQPGGRFVLAEPFIQINPKSDGREYVKAIISDKSDTQRVMATVRKQHPNLTLMEDTLEYGTEQEEGPIQISLNMGGRDSYRGMLKSIFNLLGAKNPELALHPEFDSLREFILNGEGNIGDFVHYPESLNPGALPHFNQFDHFLAVYSQSGSIDGFIQYYGTICYSVRLCSNYTGEDFQYAYQVNPLPVQPHQENREPKFNPELLPKFAECGALNNPDFQKFMTARIENFLKAWNELKLEEIAKKYEDKYAEQMEMLCKEAQSKNFNVSEFKNASNELLQNIELELQKEVQNSSILKTHNS